MEFLKPQKFDDVCAKFLAPNYYSTAKKIASSLRSQKFNSTAKCESLHTLTLNLQNQKNQCNQSCKT